MRRSFLRSRYTDADENLVSPTSDTTPSPSKVFLRMYDSPMGAGGGDAAYWETPQPTPRTPSGTSRRSLDYDDSPPLGTRKQLTTAAQADMSAATAGAATDGSSSVQEGGAIGSGGAWTQASVEESPVVENPPMPAPSPVSATFKSYCSKYGGYPEF